MNRRDLIGSGAAALAAAIADPATAASRDETLAFEVWRNGARIGNHSVILKRSDAGVVATIAADFVVRLGPVPVFHYSHRATETWTDGRFAALDARTVSAGKVETVAARREGAGVVIRRSGGPTLSAPANAAPLTHWNLEAMRAPLFNPQTGALARETIARREGDGVRDAAGRTIPATRMTLNGDAEIVDWYDAAGAWCGLRGKVSDGSWLDYRRV